MPWVDEERCTGCGTCVEACPANAITFTKAGKADINDSECIRCGTCHHVCPAEAVRHDSERIPQDVEANLRWVRRLMGNFRTEQERRALVERMVRYFNKERKVAEMTVERLRGLTL